MHMRSCVHLGGFVLGDILFACWSWLCQLCLFCSADGPELSGIRVNSYVVAAAAAPNQQARSYTTRVTIANASCHQKLVDMLAC